MKQHTWDKWFNWLNTNGCHWIFYTLQKEFACDTNKYPIVSGLWLNIWLWQVWRTSSNQPLPRSTLPSEGLLNALTLCFTRTSSTTLKSALYTVKNTNEIRNDLLRAAGWGRCWGWKRHRRLLINPGWWTPPRSSARYYSDSVRRRRCSLNSPEHPLSPYRLTDGVSSTALRRSAAPFIREGGGGRRPKPRKTSPSNASSQKPCVEDALV